MHVSPFTSQGQYGQTQGAGTQLYSFKGSVTQASATTQVQKGVDGFKVFESELARTYEFLATRGTSKTAALAPQKLTAESVANNILGFIENRLKKDQAEGATPEQLAERLEQGLAGFKKGFAEAKAQIEALAMLSPEVDEDIGKTYDLVIGGIEDLRARFVEGVVANEPEAAPAKNSSTNAAAHSKTVEAAYGSVSYGQFNSFNFSVETADGDVVTIQASSKAIYAAQYAFGAYSDGEKQGSVEAFSAYASESSRFSLSVQGELDDGELKALNDLLAKVEDLSQAFFTGNLDDAFNQAVNLGYDSQEIVGFSLNLRQVEVERVRVAYQQFLPEPTRAPQTQAAQGQTGELPMAERLAPLGDFVQGLLDALDTANRFEEPARLVTDIAEQFDKILDTLRAQQDAPAAENNRFSRFIKDLLDAMPSDRG